MNIPTPSSITHQHLVSIVATELKPNKVVRVLDVGCGRGKMISFFHQALTVLFPDSIVEIYGFDQAGHGAFTMGGPGEEAIKYLSREIPEVRWEDRICTVPPGAQWPWEGKFFDAAVSNQVLEHVRDFDDFFEQTYRVLKPGGISAHLFPLKNYIYEGHIFVPIAHRIQEHDLAVSYLRLMHRLGFGKLDAEGKPSRKGFADPVMQADWLRRFTNYARKRDFLSICRKHDFRASFRYTQEFYTAKIRQVMKLKPVYVYKRNRSVMFDRTSFLFFKYISGITLFLQKPEYDEHTELLHFAPEQVPC
jgi:SAM-dependent methyltransferase